MEDRGRRSQGRVGSIRLRSAIVYPPSSILYPQFLFSILYPQFLLPLLLPGANRPAGQFPNFEGTDDAAPIIGVQTRCCSRVDGGEALVQDLTARTVCLLSEAAAQLGVSGRTVEQAAQQGFEIERCAAHEQNAFSSILDLLQATGSFFEPPSHAGRFPRLEHGHQMVRHAPTFFRSRLGGTDVHTPVQRHRIHRDNLRAQTLGQLDTEGGLAATGGPRENQCVAENIRVHTERGRRTGSSVESLLFPQGGGRYGEAFMSVGKEETRLRAAKQALDLAGVLERHTEELLRRFRRQTAE